MATIAWRETMSVGSAEFDNDHKTLLGLINSLHRALGETEEHATLGSVLAALEQYTVYHFAREEAVMERMGYPFLADHILAHRQLADHVRELKQAFDAGSPDLRALDCLKFLHEWLIDHICTDDMNYRPWVVPAVAGAAEEGDGQHREHMGAIDWPGVRVMVLDEDPDFLQLVKAILEGVGVVHLTLTGAVAEAKARMEQEPADIVVIDCLADEQGLEMLAWMRGEPDWAKVPVLMMCGYAHHMGREAALAAGADEFIEKPISARAFLNGLAELLVRVATR